MSLSRFQKFKKELSDGIRYTQDGQKKLDKSGNEMRLDEKAKSYRAGYRQAVIDAAAARSRSGGQPTKKSNSNFINKSFDPKSAFQKALERSKRLTGNM